MGARNPQWIQDRIQALQKELEERQKALPHHHAQTLKILLLALMPIPLFPLAPLVSIDIAQSANL